MSVNVWDKNIEIGIVTCALHARQCSVSRTSAQMREQISRHLCTDLKLFLNCHESWQVFSLLPWILHLQPSVRLHLKHKGQKMSVRISQALSLLMLCAPSNRRQPFSYHILTSTKSTSLEWVGLRARRVHMRFVRVVGRGKRVFKDSVRLIARVYSRFEHDKPLEC